MEQLQLQETYAVTGPQLEILGEVESRLPEPARKKPTAALFLVAMVLVSTVGLGGMKMTGAYNKALSVYNATNRYNQGIQNDFVTSADAAASLIRQCVSLPECSDAAKEALSALDAWNSRPGNATPGEEYLLNHDLYQAVEELYNTAANYAGGDQKARISELHSTFTSAQATIDRAAAQEYNPAAKEYNNKASGFPGSLIGSLWGVGHLETFSGN